MAKYSIWETGLHSSQNAVIFDSFFLQFACYIASYLQPCRFRDFTLFAQKWADIWRLCTFLREVNFPCMWKRRQRKTRWALSRESSESIPRSLRIILRKRTSAAWRFFFRIATKVRLFLNLLFTTLNFLGFPNSIPQKPIYFNCAGGLSRPRWKFGRVSFSRRRRHSFFFFIVVTNGNKLINWAWIKRCPLLILEGIFLSSIVVIVVIVFSKNGPIRIHYLRVFIGPGLVGQEEGYCSVIFNQSVRMSAIFINFQNPNMPFSETKQTFLKW